MIYKAPTSIKNQGALWGGNVSYMFFDIILVSCHGTIIRYILFIAFCYWSKLFCSVEVCGKPKVGSDLVLKTEPSKKLTFI